MVNFTISLALSAGTLMASAGTQYRPVPAHFYPCMDPSPTTLEITGTERIWSPLTSATGCHGWRRGIVVSGVRRMSEVNARRARLQLGWVTVFGRVYHLGL